MSTETESVDLVGEQVVVNVARAALLAALTGAFAYVSFPYPLSPAPITLQVLGVFLAGILLGPVWGGASMVLYLAAGAVGAPIYSGGASGLGSLFGSLGGYLWSYPVAAAAIGLVVHRGRSLVSGADRGVVRLVAGMALGTVIIYAFGVVGLMVAGNLGLTTAVMQGAVVFLPAEGVKMVAAVGIVRSDRIAAE